jgi:hypothetical protein
MITTQQTTPITVVLSITAMTSYFGLIKPVNVFKISIIIVTVSQKAEFSTRMLSSWQQKQSLHPGPLLFFSFRYYTFIITNKEGQKLGLKKMILKSFKYKLVILSVLWVAFQSGCVGPGQMTVPPERRIPLVKDTPQEGSWESNDVALKYQYVEQIGGLQLNVAGRAKRGYDQLVIWLKLVDAEGKVLETKTIYNSGFRSGSSRGKSHKGTIEKTLEIPPGTIAIAFQSMLTPRKPRR